MKRTQIEDFKKIEKADDLEKVARDKRKGQASQQREGKKAKSALRQNFIEASHPKTRLE